MGGKRPRSSMSPIIVLQHDYEHQAIYVQADGGHRARLLLDESSQPARVISVGAAAGLNMISETLNVLCNMIMVRLHNDRFSPISLINARTGCPSNTMHSLFLLQHIDAQGGLSQEDAVHESRVISTNEDPALLEEPLFSTLSSGLAARGFSLSSVEEDVSYGIVQAC